MAASASASAASRRLRRVALGVFLNVPIGIALFIALVLLLPRGVHTSESRSIDLLEGTLLTAGTGALIWATINAGEAGVWH